MKPYLRKLTAALLAAALLAGCGNNPAQSGGLSDNTGTTNQADTVNQADTASSGNDIPSTDGDANAQTVAETQNNETDALAAAPSILDTPGAKTLSISYCWSFYYMEDTARNFMAKYPDVQINVTGYDNDYEKYTSQTSTALMSGLADDLLDGYGLSYRDPSTVKLLADFYPVMQADPWFNPDDFYMNVFEAMSHQGGLYTFPLSFSYDLVVANNRVSDAFTDRYAQYPSVTVFDLIDMHAAAPEYAISQNFDVITGLTEMIDSFVDFENRTCDFNNPRFIDYLVKAKAATAPDKAFGYTYGSNAYAPDVEAENSKKYLFQPVSADVYQYHFDFEEETDFSGLKPITNEHGQMRMAPLKNFCISQQSANKELAWEFIKFMMDPSSGEDENGHSFIPSIPVYKPLFFSKMDMELKGLTTTDAAEDTGTWQLSGWPQMFEQEYGWHITGDKERQINDVIAQMDEYNQRPLYDPVQNLYALISEPVEQYHNGVITAEQCAQELQNKLSLALME